MSTIVIKEELTSYELGARLWSGAVDTWKEIEKAGKEASAIDYLNDIFCGETPDIMQVNDALWFDRESVLEALGIVDENVKEVELCFNETDLDSLYEAEDLVQYLKKELEARKPIALLYTDINTIEDDLKRELTEDEIETLFDLGR